MGKLKEEDWGTYANCYAYAANCSKPARGDQGGAVPGGAKGKPALTGLADLKDYERALIAGAAADGFVQREGAPAAPPAPNANHYLVALIANKLGFHWLRRDSVTDRWSWKDGNGQTVKYNIFDVRQKRFVYISNTNLDDLLTVNRGSYFPWAYTNMSFVSFFEAPAPNGVVVAGR
jgi:hypothetical protein